MKLDKETLKDICYNDIRTLWLEAEDTFPDFLIEVSKETKHKNEEYIREISDALQKQFNKIPKLNFGRKRWIKKNENLIHTFLQEETVLGVHRTISEHSLHAYQEELKTFLRRARSFAPELSLEGIGQAIRNYIVYIMFVELYQKESDFHTACFGYSMLYPYTDNYIDSSHISEKEKQQYNQMIKDKLEGKKVNPVTIHHQKTCELLQMIEDRYPREEKPSIFLLLLMMLEAQEYSLSQQKLQTQLTVEERLKISLYKGGTSVFIDRYFVDREITKDDLIFYLSFGFFLQLADDLQDIKSDSTYGNQTLFTVDFHYDQEEKLVNKLFHFLHRIINNYPMDHNNYKEFMLTNCCQLIFSSIAGSKEFFSKEYLNQLERYLPVTYPFMENMQINRFEHIDLLTEDKYMQVLDIMIR